MSGDNTPQDEKSNVVQFTPKSKPQSKAPKPQPLLPDGIDPFEELHTSDEVASLTGVLDPFQKNEAKPASDLPTMADIDKVRKQFDDAIARAAHLKLASNISVLDVTRVAEMCKNEPWKKGRLSEVATSNFGFIPEKFEAAANQHPEGSPEHTQFMAACMEARTIYWDQIKLDVKKTFDSFNKPGRSPRDVRIDCEGVNEILRSGYKRFEENPVFKHQYGRLLWAALALGEAFSNAHQSGQAGMGAGYQQYKLVLDPFTGPDIQAVKKNPAPGPDLRPELGN